MKKNVFNPPLIAVVISAEQNAVLKKAALTLRALNHPLRIKLVELIEDKRSITVSEVYKRLRLEQSVCSAQLGILRRAGVVNAKRNGQKIFYSVNGKRIAEIGAIAEKIAQDSLD